MTARTTLRQLKIQQSGAVESLLTYNLDNSHSPPTNVPPNQVLPSISLATSFMNTYFSTVHVAYPFLSRERFESFLPQLWEGEPELTDTWKAIICMILILSYFLT